MLIQQLLFTEKYHKNKYCIYFKIIINLYIIYYIINKIEFVGGPTTNFNEKYLV